MNYPAYLDDLLSLPIREYRPREDFADPDLRDFDAILVLGHQLESDGSIKPRLSARLEAAHGLSLHNQSAAIVLTGGMSGADRSEAEAMALWLRERRIDPQRMHLEKEAADTLENAAYSLPILRRLGVERTVLVSSSYHVRRSLALLRILAERRGDRIIFRHLASVDPKKPARSNGANEEERALILRDFERAVHLDLSHYEDR